jgi:hypothetical protein
MENLERPHGARVRASGRGYSGLIFAAQITLAHFSVSSAMNRDNNDEIVGPTPFVQSIDYTSPDAANIDEDLIRLVRFDDRERATFTQAVI